MAEKKSLWNTEIVATALLDSVRKLDPRGMVKNPVMFVVEVGSVLTTALLINDTMNHRPGFGFNLQITLWLWFTVLFANFAEAMAEARGENMVRSVPRARCNLSCAFSKLSRISSSLILVCALKGTSSPVLRPATCSSRNFCSAAGAVV